MALQNTDFFLVNRAGTGHRLAWSELQSTTEGSLQIQDVFSYTGATGATTAAQTDVPVIVDQGIRLPVAGTGDYNVDGAIRYSPSNSKLEMYYSGAWNTASGGTVFGATPPSPATEGDVWYDTDNGRSYVYYNDGTSSQWVEMNPAWDGGTPPDSIGTTEIQNGSVTPAKLSTGGPQWTSAGNVGIGTAASTGTDKLTIRGTNSASDVSAVNLIQGNAAGGQQQTFAVIQNGASKTSKLVATNSTGTGSSVAVTVDGSDKLTIPGSGNITTPVGITATGGFTGNLTGTASDATTATTATNCSRTVFSGAGLIGGGALMSNVTLNVAQGDGISVGADAVSVDSTVVRTTGNQTLAGNKTFSGTVTTNGVLNCRGNLDLADNDILRFGSGDDVELFTNGSNFYMDLNSGIGNFYIRDGSTTRYTFNDNGNFTATGTITASSFSGNATTATTATNCSRSVTGGNGLTGGGTLTSNRTLSVGAGTGISVGADAVSVDSTVVRTTGNQTLAGNKTFSGTVTTNGVLNCRGNLDLADNDILRFGSGDDAELFTNGSDFYMDLNSGIGNFYIRDGSTTRYTFNDNGNFTATGTITASSFSGNATTADSATNANKPKRNTWSGEFTWKDVTAWNSTSESYEGLSNATNGYVQLSGDGKLRASGSISTEGNITASGNLNGTLGNSQVRDAIALGGAGDLGTYALLKYIPNFVVVGTAIVNRGGTVGGSELRFAAASGRSNHTPNGTWQCMGRAFYDASSDESKYTTLWLRIA